MSTGTSKDFGNESDFSSNDTITMAVDNLIFSNDMDIWNVDSREWTKLRLWRINPNQFRVIEAGTYEPILTNPAYILVNKKYSSAFKSLDDEVEMTPIKIHDFLTKKCNEDYIELKILNDISPETINTLDSFGRKLWSCYGNLFVSGNLKEELCKLSEKELAFSLGFSMFGGINAEANNIGF